MEPISDLALLPGLREALKWKPNTPQLENAMTYAWESALKSFIRALETKERTAPRSETGSFKWVPVSERLPEEGQRVLAIQGPHRHIVTAFRRDEFFGGFADWPAPSGGAGMPNITHWTEYPEHP